ncbi:MAG: hypothetical protein ACRCTE_10640 [Cellulosilyticaceae bacterium]
MKKRRVIVIITALIISIVAFNGINENNTTEQQKMLEEAVSRALIQCYAIEGAYPSDIEYIKTHYGVQINEEKYIVFYESIAPNIMPNIRVIAKD